MANPSEHLIEAFRKTIQKLKNDAPYQWGHMGACNCGNLAQQLTKLSKAEIHQFAMQKSGDWNDQLIDFCPTSGYPMDLMIQRMIEAGLSIDELKHLERLSDPKVLQHIPFEKREKIKKNRREDVILYMETWLELLETEYIDHLEIHIPENSKKKIFA
jgi:hypothetical protein